MEKERYEVRFYVSRKLYDRLKKHADEYGESVGVFARHIVFDRLKSLDAVEMGESVPAMLKMMEYMVSADSDDAKEKAPVLMEMIEAVASGSEDTKKVLPVVMKMMETIVSGSEGKDSSVPQNCGTK